MRLPQFWLCVLALLLTGAGPSDAGEVSLGVAANFTSTTRALIRQFEAETGHSVRASFGSTGKLYAQIRNGAPYDVFMAADIDRPERIEAESLGVAGTRFTYAMGRLVLWSPDAGTFAQGEAFLAGAGFSRLAIANPDTAPYGLAAQQVLERLGLWSQLQSRLVRGDSIAQTFQFVASGNAEAGLVALSQVHAWSGPRGSLWQIPPDYYRPIEQQAILLQRGAGNDAARAWLNFLKSETALRIIRSYGYEVPG